MQAEVKYKSHQIRVCSSLYERNLSRQVQYNSMNMIETELVNTRPVFIRVTHGENQSYLNKHAKGRQTNYSHHAGVHKLSPRGR